MTVPLVSIVVATHRPRPDHLHAALRSALGQTWTNLEVIVSDDSPTRAARDVAMAFSDTRLRYVKHDRALGAAGNHWWSFAAARGEWLAILNHDDVFEAEFVASMMAPLLAERNAALAFCDHWIVDVDGRRLLAESEGASRTWGRAGLAPGLHRPFLGLLAAQAVPMAMGTVFQRSLLPDALPRTAGPAYDLWLTYLLARDGHGAIYVPRRLSSWRCHQGNLTSQAGADWILGSVACWLAVADDPRCQPIHRVARRRAAAGLSSLAARALAHGERADAQCHARAALRAATSTRALAAWCVAHLPSACGRWIVSSRRSRARPLAAERRA